MDSAPHTQSHSKTHCVSSRPSLTTTSIAAAIDCFERTSTRLPEKSISWESGKTLHERRQSYTPRHHTMSNNKYRGYFMPKRKRIDTEEEQQRRAAMEDKRSARMQEPCAWCQHTRLKHDLIIRCITECGCLRFMEPKSTESLNEEKVEMSESL